MDAVRKEPFGVDIGQNSWLTVDEYERWLPWLAVTSGEQVLEVASGSGGPARYVARATGCHVTGVDANPSGVATSAAMASAAGESASVQLSVADANARLPFDDGSFDALSVSTSMNIFPIGWRCCASRCRVLRAGRRALFTDPVVVTGPVTNDELALRSSIGLFLFVPPGVNERLIGDAGFQLVRQEDVTANAALVAGRWHQARAAHEADLLRIEGAERFSGLQQFFKAVHDLTSERRLSRIAYLVEKR